MAQACEYEENKKENNITAGSLGLASDQQKALTNRSKFSCKFQELRMPAKTREADTVFAVQNNSGNNFLALLKNLYINELFQERVNLP